jgi:ABC-type antimicrobial peptide transport system permease subunit
MTVEIWIAFIGVLVAIAIGFITIVLMLPGTRLASKQLADLEAQSVKVEASSGDPANDAKIAEEIKQFNSTLPRYLRLQSGTDPRLLPASLEGELEASNAAIGFAIIFIAAFAGLAGSGWYVADRFAESFSYVAVIFIALMLW